MALLSAEQILAAQDLEAIDVPVPEWGGSVRLRMMNAGERDEYESIAIEANDTDARTWRRRMRARLLCFTIVGEDGELLFSQEDIEALAKKGVRPVQRLYNVASRLNALTLSDEDELAKNCAAIPAGSTSSS